MWVLYIGVRLGVNQILELDFRRFVPGNFVVVLYRYIGVCLEYRVLFTGLDIGVKRLLVC